MADKREVRRNIKRLQHIKTWQLVILLILLGFITATFLRLNNVGMVQRRDAVIAADKQGDETAIQNRLYELQVYSSSHMNASSGDIYLDNRYNADANAAIEKAKNQSQEGKTVNKIADDTCRAQFTGYSRAYVLCVASELDKLAPSDDDGTIKVDLPSPGLYKHSYISSLWTFDFAGLSLLLTLLVALAVVLRIVSMAILRLLLRQRYRSHN